MRKSCQYCGGIHQYGAECPQKPKRKKQHGRREDSFRSSYKWQQKREQIRQRDYYLCRYCLAHGRFTYDGLEVHHIVPLAVDWERRLDDDNLISLCGEHHEQAERGEIAPAELRAAVDMKPGYPPTH